MRKFLVVTCLALVLTACSPVQVQSWLAGRNIHVTPGQAEGISRHLNKMSMGCYEAVDSIFPEEAKARMRLIVKRESGGNPRAKNRASTASGCTQMLKVHSARFRKLGYSWDQRFVAYVNVTVAYDLWRDQGWRPWVLTAY